MTFTHETLGQRVLFGTGRAAEHVAAEIDRLGASRPMIVAGASERALAETATAGTTLRQGELSPVVHSKSA